MNWLSTRADGNDGARPKLYIGALFDPYVGVLFFISRIHNIYHFFAADTGDDNNGNNVNTGSHLVLLIKQLGPWTTRS